MFSQETNPLSPWFLQSYLFQVSTPGRFQMSKEALRSSTASLILSQMPDFQQESQLFTELHLAKIEKMFKDNVNANEGKAALWA